MKKEECPGEIEKDRDAFGRNPDAFEMIQRALAPSKVLWGGVS